MPNVIQLSRADDHRDVVHRAVQALAEGKLVAFPTETVYGIAASALDQQAVERLRVLKQRSTDNPIALAIRSAEQALDYAPRMTPLAKRLARRCWPGPVTLVMDDDHPDSVLRQLPQEVQQAVCQNETVGLRVPAHTLILDVLKLMAGPLVLTSANRADEPETVTGDEVAAALGDDVDMILDDGRCQFGQPSSVVRVGNDNRLSILRAGVLGGPMLRRLSSLMVLFVCTGNTCRSPMAEILMKQRIADRLGCTLEELEDRGVLVMSAGIAAMAGGRCATEAALVMRDRGLDLSTHESQPLTERLVRFADLILTMTRGHREAVVAQWPSSADRTFVLGQERDVADPIGGPRDLYAGCAAEIDGLLTNWIDRIDLNSIPTAVDEEH